MLDMKLSESLLAAYPHFQESRWPTVQPMLERAVLLLAFTLSIFFILIFGIYFLANLSGKPVPGAATDMARNKTLRTAMLGFSVLLTPPVLMLFVPTEAAGAGGSLATTYLSEIFIGVACWLMFDIVFKK